MESIPKPATMTSRQYKEFYVFLHTVSAGQVRMFGGGDAALVWSYLNQFGRATREDERRGNDGEWFLFDKSDLLDQTGLTPELATPAIVALKQRGFITEIESPFDEGTFVRLNRTRPDGVAE